MALIAVAAWLNTTPDKLPKEMRLHTCAATKEAWARVVDAIRALPAHGVGVKPLVWQEANEGNYRKGECFTTRSPISFTPIAAHKKHDGWWLNVDCKTYPTLDAARAAAQADYEARILAALAPTTAADPGDDVSPSASDPVTTPPPGAAAAAVAPTDAAQARQDDTASRRRKMMGYMDDQKGGDAHVRRLRSHEASPGVTAGADAAQAREDP